jgi:hypothetical protein
MFMSFLDWEAPQPRQRNGFEEQEQLDVDELVVPAHGMMFQFLVKDEPSPFEELRDSEEHARSRKRHELQDR